VKKKLVKNKQLRKAQLKKKVKEKRAPLREREKKVHQLDLMESLLLKVKVLPKEKKVVFLKVKKDPLLVRMEKY